MLFLIPNHRFKYVFVYSSRRAGETQILDYQAQRYKLFPLIALSHVLRGMFAILMEMYKQANTDLERGVLDTLPELHAISSGLKALCSDMASRGIEVQNGGCSLR